MITNFFGSKKYHSLLAGLALTAAAFAAQAEDVKPVVVGWVNWADAEITTKLAKLALEDQLKQPVKLVMADIGIQFQAMAAGKVDMIPMAWLTYSHKPFWEKYQDKLEDLGVIYEGRLGLAVSTNIPESEIKSIEDLNKPEVREKLGGKILTSEVGNGQYKTATRAISDYKLEGYKLVASSETGMLNEFDRSLKRDQWALLNAWSPHWMFSTWSLRYLDDPKEVYGKAEQIHAVGRKGFTNDFPQVANFFSHYTLPLKDLEGMMKKARETSADQVVAEYYASHKDTFTAMFKGGATVATQQQ
ncbi:ProX [Pseudomonas caricapapayae]|uniref:ProX n=1 Tax=Pseudomonas caricapapayae TaxID=46678 RepID=A0A0P9K032_9PSED|nr:glycine betaine ABC transporter substrate-binding protein [Pseudomonas caricapapayae]KAA8696569.1 glycine betaine ABC transporter substrate-binding protein [Pseudomonas caricapapayae]KPW55537.1 ProX [Pseudomonas caricapapayae]RMM04561.1 ProX [Pseudomonas caricapapayae]RMV78918.1 ProX [Pseudomonas caricapapayae]RMW00986.1 ProX [Pseudomonas caricapapayae]